MKNNNHIPEFSIIGGQLHKPGLRLGLVRQGVQQYLAGFSHGSWLLAVVTAAFIDSRFAFKVFFDEPISYSYKAASGSTVVFLCETLPSQQV